MCSIILFVAVVAVAVAVVVVVVVVAVFFLYARSVSNVMTIPSIKGAVSRGFRSFRSILR